MGGGVGIDLLDVGRFERALERRPRLAERVFTDAERAYAASRPRPAMHLAARFCAKEAVAKALELRAWSWRDVEVVGGGTEPPAVRPRSWRSGRRSGCRATRRRWPAGCRAASRPPSGRGGWTART